MQKKPDPDPNWGQETSDLDTLEMRHRHIESWPSFEAIRQYEWIRAGGKYNMVADMGKVIDEMHRLRFFDALEWFNSCKESKVFFGFVYSDAVKHYETEIPRKEWFDTEFKRSIKKCELDEKKSELKRLQRELNRLEKESEG